MNFLIFKKPNETTWSLSQQEKTHFMKLGLHVSFQESLPNPVSRPQDFITLEIALISGWASTGHGFLIS